MPCCKALLSAAVAVAVWGCIIPDRTAAIPSMFVAPTSISMSGCLVALIVCAAAAVPLAGILAAIAIPAYRDYVERARHDK